MSVFRIRARTLATPAPREWPTTVMEYSLLSCREQGNDDLRDYDTVSSQGRLEKPSKGRYCVKGTWLAKYTHMEAKIMVPKPQLERY